MFVSNSSSSSFIIFLDKKPKDKEELKGMLFDGIEEIEVYGYKLAVDEIASIVFESLGEDYSNWEQLEKKDLYGTILGYEELMIKHEKLDKEFFDGCKEMKDEYSKNNPNKLWYNDEEWSNKFYNYCNNKLKENQTEYMKDLKKLYDDLKGNKKCYLINFSDDTNDGNVLEHGDIFRNIPNIQISEH